MKLLSSKEIRGSRVQFPSGPKNESNAKMVDITKHTFVSKHTKLSEEETAELLKRYNITLKQLPKISNKDPVIKGIDTKRGDVFKIIRDSKTNKEAVFYRVVVHE